MLDKEKLNNKFANFNDAFTVFERIFLRYQACSDDEALQMAVTQAFEFSVELGWKLLKLYLEQEGLQAETPKETVRRAFQTNILQDKDGDIWMNAIKMRNLTSHTYRQETLNTLLTHIETDFRPALARLRDYFKNVTQ